MCAVKTLEPEHQLVCLESLDGTLPLGRTQTRVPNQHTLIADHLSPARQSSFELRIVVLHCSKILPIYIGIYWGRTVHVGLPTAIDKT